MIAKFRAALLFSFMVTVFNVHAQKSKWSKGILVDEFIYTEAPFPQAHASTIAETPDGLIAAWFGGTKEGYKDVCIWTSRMVNNKWTAPMMVADGVMNDTLRYP